MIEASERLRTQLLRDAVAFGLESRRSLKRRLALLEDRAPAASLDQLKAWGAPTYSRAPPEQLGGWPCPRKRALSVRPTSGDFPLSTDRSRPSAEDLFEQGILKVPPGSSISARVAASQEQL